MEDVGILVHDVMKCLPNEVGELMYCLEFIVYNTPGPHGFTPRDVDRRWSLTSPIAWELTPFQAGEFEPLSDYAAILFKAYRDIRAYVLRYL